MNTMSGISISYLGIMLALTRAADADAAQQQIGLAIAAAETALWVRALTDDAKINVHTFEPDSDEGILRALRITANKAIHQQIHPHKTTPKYDFLRTLIISSSFEYAWQPYEAWKDLVTEYPVGSEDEAAYRQHLEGRSVVVSFSAAVDRLRHLTPPDSEEARAAIAVLDAPQARRRFY